MDILDIIAYITGMKETTMPTMKTAGNDTENRLHVSLPRLQAELRFENPDVPTPLLDTMGEAMAKFVNAAGSMDMKALAALSGSTNELLVAVCRVIADKPPIQEPGNAPPVEVSTGEGLGTPLSKAKAAERLLRLAEPTALESWAGNVWRPSDIKDRLGISRSTLDNWRQKNMVIALNKGLRAHVYPADQFAEGRPVKGLKGIVAAAAGNHHVAWRWLVTPHIDFDKTPPLTALKEGQVEAVLDAVHRSFS
ncbi:hypothetical protein HPQ64_03735 [Rhizobiales bacterium]|uniref:antitoxin Xre/MbcA/ParS-like domain-containing protein n=1 Tax=Hongsoonwoonella zoysiae TaxID=2821844 RepID=UPI001561237D|nr:hypothetical protein [Hongsoonwoonella zoysiae]NRG16798.1 hypothetical protein [Hongsoonwoonella zoysiae]